jgi:ribosome-associated translation inhibitor RaiA
MTIAVQAQRLKRGAQVRVYVENRMFSAISRFAPRCARLGVHLEACESAQLGTRYRCTVALDLTPAARVRVRATADRLYSAVDQAAERLSRRVELMETGANRRSPQNESCANLDTP